MQLQLKHLAEMLGGELEGSGDLSIHSVSSLDKAEEGCITFLANLKYEHLIYDTRASAIIIGKNLKLKKPVAASLIRVDDPYLSFSVLLEEYRKISDFNKKGLEPPNHIGKNSTFGDNFYLGSFAYVGDDVRIGKNVKIHPQAFIGNNVQIGDNCIIYPGVKIYEKTIIGSYCTIHAGAVVGSHGFGFAPQPDGSYKNIPQTGNVILEDHVDVGANTTIDCGTLESTIIRRGVKIDNLVQIAHNVEIGEHTVIASQTGISGSTVVGRHVVIGGQVGVAGHIQVADGTKVGGQTGITRTVRKNDSILFGTPAVDKQSFMKSYAIYKKLPELMERIEQVEQKILNLPQDEQ